MDLLSPVNHYLSIISYTRERRRKNKSSGQKRGEGEKAASRFFQILVELKRTGSAFRDFLSIQRRVIE
ncbi:hypothetical protein AA984_11975 [Brevibacillus formosus]|uniref:Uncharacterized protein n=1 Tax=Brevibacillus formosus TaxID=54913 RepID=A0A837KQK0_9BACL|nr:hypothetical protein AA984_11975 [Brevibacillus formosus]